MEPRHLFLDLHGLTRIERLHRRVHQPRRHPQNPILRGENPWEAVASLYGTVPYDAESRFRMWYLTGPYRSGMIQVRGRRALGNITLLGRPLCPLPGGAGGPGGEGAIAVAQRQFVLVLVCLTFADQGPVRSTTGLG